MGWVGREKTLAVLLDKIIRACTHLLTPSLVSEKMGICNGFPVLIFIVITEFFIIPFTTSTCFENTTFSFTGFNPNMHQINYEGDAFAEQQVIQLTKTYPDLTNNLSVGRSTYKDPMHLWDKVSMNLADFSTQFSFRVHWQENASKGDGFAFFLAPNGSHLMENSGGGNLGLLSTSQVSSSSLASFVAIEFDTFWNENFDDPSDQGDHVGININSMRSERTDQWDTGGANGVRINAWVTYDSGSKNLSVRLTGDDDTVRSRLCLTVDLRDYLPEWVTFGFSGATGDHFETHTILSWDFRSSLKVPVNVTDEAGTVSPATGSSSKTGLLVAVGVFALVLVILVLGIIWFVCWIMRNLKEPRLNNVNASSREEEDIDLVTGPRKFSYKSLVVATSNFAEGGLLGEGGFGRVYLGFLRDMNANVAVKRITPQSRQGLKEYVSEVETISRLRHRNLVKLIGWCNEKQELLIVYEFLPNKSLDFHLFNEARSLTWEKRYRIAQGLAAGLFYMQEECEDCVLHRDIKSSNVLLDLSFNAKLADFGLARLVQHGAGTQTTALLGTDGYIAPEYLETRKATKATDAYSFGIVALEIASGKQAIGKVNINGKKYRITLEEWVWEQYRNGSMMNAADGRLDQNYDVEQMERLIVVGLACSHPNQHQRFCIKQAIDVLNFKAPLPVLPSEMPTTMYFSAADRFHLYANLSVCNSEAAAAALDRGQLPYSNSSWGATTSSKGSSSTASLI